MKMPTQEQIESLWNAIHKKANSNHDKQAMIRPSEYGYSDRSEGRDVCRAYLESFHEVRRVEVAAKNLLRVYLV